MNAIIIRENKKKFPFYIKEEQKEKFKVYTIYDEHKITGKRLIKKLNKDCITKVAFDNNISHDFIECFKGEINIVTKDYVLFMNLDKVILKLSNMLGIKEGKLTLGLIPEFKTDLALKKIEMLKNKLKVLFIYCDCKEEYSGYADSFYKKTGVPVIIKEGNYNISCDILVNLKLNKPSLRKFKGHIVDIFDKLDKKGVRDIKAKIKNNHNIYNISDAVFLKISEEPFFIDSFITKNA